MNDAPPQIAQKALASTVLIVTENAFGEGGSGSGTGFFVQDGLIATNRHVIDGATAIRVRLVNQTASYPCSIDSIAEQDAERDLALLRISTLKAPPLPLGDSDRLQVGETVYAVGNPLGLEGTFTKGEISNIHSDGLISNLRMKPVGKIIQMTPPIASGSSGGPVLNARGEVVGVSTFTVPEGQNLNFAVPSNALRKMIEPIRGKDSKHSISIDLFESLKGVEKTLVVMRGGEKKRIRLNIPAGIESGKTLRVLGAGYLGKNGGPPGDLRVAVHVKEHPQYRREGLNVIVDLEVPFTTATRGCKARIETLDGPVNINIPKRAQEGPMLRLVGRGVKKGRTVGDLLVNIVVQEPSAASSAPPSPEPPPKQQSGSFFDDRNEDERIRITVEEVPDFDDREEDGRIRDPVKEAPDSDSASGCGIAILTLIVIALAIYGIISLIRSYL